MIHELLLTVITINKWPVIAIEKEAKGSLVNIEFWKVAIISAKITLSQG